MSDRTSTGRGWRFVVTGLVVNGTLFVVLWLLLQTDIGYVTAITIVYVLSMAWGYLQNRLWSWKSDAPLMRSVSLYLLVYGGIYVAHTGFVMLLVERAGLDPLVAVFVSVAVLVGPIFVALDRLVFRTRAD